MDENKENSKHNSLVPAGNKNLMRLGNSMEITDKILKESKLRAEDLVGWWKNLDKVWQTIFCLNYFGEDAYEKHLNRDFSAEEIGKILKIKRLVCSDEFLTLSIKNTSPINKLTELTHLVLHGNLKCRFEINKTLPKTKNIELFSNRITDLSFLKFFPNLESFDGRFNKITDLSSLKYLINLETLDICYNKITDLSPLHSLNNLKKLIIDNNEINDLSPLQQLAKLENLNIEHNQINDLSPLQNLYELKILRIANNRIADLSSLRYLINLETLDICYNKITDLSPLQCLTNLKTLNLYRTRTIDNQIFDDTIIRWLQE